MTDITTEINMPEPNEWPKAVGYRLLLQPLTAEEVSAGGIVLPSSTQEANKFNVKVSKVIDMGPLAYTHEKFKVAPERDPVPWCQVGDWVVHTEYVGSRISLRSSNGEPVTAIICNDDEILSTIGSPKNLVAYT